MSMIDIKTQTDTHINLVFRVVFGHMFYDSCGCFLMIDLTKWVKTNEDGYLLGEEAIRCWSP